MSMKNEAKGGNPYKVVAIALAVALLLVLAGLVHYVDKYKGLENGIVEAKLAQEKLLSEKLAAEKAVYLKEIELEELLQLKQGIELKLEESNAQLTAFEKRYGKSKKTAQSKTNVLQGKETNKAEENTSDTRFVIYPLEVRSDDKKKVKTN